jgi:RNA polymerase sigma factor (sigma-70 family)
MISFSDEDIIAQIQAGNDRSLNALYSKCKSKAIRFLTINGADYETAQDIFQDGVIVFFEKVREGNFEKKSSIQTYLNSVCRFKLLNTIRDKREFISPSDFSFDETIKDDFETFAVEKEERISLIETQLTKLKAKGGKCYDILFAYFYEGKNMENIAQQFEYTNAENAKNQKAKCQKQLKEMVYGGV